jgi:hypothetical protein
MEDLEKLKQRTNETLWFKLQSVVCAMYDSNMFYMADRFEELARQVNMPDYYFADITSASGCYFDRRRNALLALTESGVDEETARDVVSQMGRVL